jgi:hypothetical protein
MCYITINNILILQLSSIFEMIKYKMEYILSFGNPLDFETNVCLDASFCFATGV